MQLTSVSMRSSALSIATRASSCSSKSRTSVDVTVITCGRVLSALATEHEFDVELVELALEEALLDKRLSIFSHET